MRNTKTEIKDACKKEGLERYTQVYQGHDTTPFVRSSLLKDLGFQVDTDFVDQILNGTYECKPDVDHFIKCFINELQKPAKLESISGIATTKEHINGWRKMKPKLPLAPLVPTLQV